MSIIGISAHRGDEGRPRRDLASSKEEEELCRQTGDVVDRAIRFPCIDHE
jgi:hypothetical protein